MNKTKEASWFGYKHIDGHLKLKRYSPTGFADAKFSTFVEEVYGPWEGSRQQAENKLNDIAEELKPPPSFLPYNIDDSEMAGIALGAHGPLFQKLMPKNIPSEYHTSKNKYNELVTGMLCGTRRVWQSDWVPCKGVNKRMAIANIRGVSFSFEPSTEDKIAACAYMIATWFEQDTVK